jgi:hypothetical protein
VHALHAGDDLTPRAEKRLQKILLPRPKLGRGNPNPGNIGADFGRFGLIFWDEVEVLDLQYEARRGLLEKLNIWRNAISHQDFDANELSEDAIDHRMVLSWRDACDGLAISFDEVMRTHIRSVIGRSPW